MRHFVRGWTGTGLVDTVCVPSGLAGAPASAPTPVEELLVHPVAVRLLLLLLVATPVSAGCRREPVAEDPDAALRRAGERTIAAGRLRFRGHVEVGGGDRVAIEGATSLDDTAAHVTAVAETSPPSPPAEVRVISDRAWVRSPGALVWTEVPPEVAAASPATSWRALLRDVTGATAVTRSGQHRLRGRVRGGTVAVVLDTDGRIRHLHLRAGQSSIALELFAFGDPVSVTPP